MAKRKKKKKQPAAAAPREKLPLRGLGRLLILIFGSAVTYGIYRFAVSRGFLAIFWIYFGLLLAAGLAYIVVNRGFALQTLTAEDLPQDWNDEKKAAFLAARDRRKKQSSWLLLLVFPLTISFLLDWFDLFLLDWLRSALKGG